MGKRSLKKYDAAFKARVAVAALQESETLALRIPSHRDRLFRSIVITCSEAS